MEEVLETKYLGFVISENASNVPNISDKKQKSIGTIQIITFLTKKKILSYSSFSKHSLKVP